MRIKLVLLATLIAFSTCFAEKQKANSDTEMVRAFREIVYERDSLKCYIDNINLQKFDNTAKNMAQAQGFYSEAFNQIQNSFSCFLTYVSIIVSIILAIVAIVTGTSIYNHIMLSKYDKKLSDLKREIENQKNDLRTTRDSIFKEIAVVYFSSALEYLNKDWLSHFTYLRRYYDLIIDKRLELTGVDLGYLEQLYNSIIKLYQGSDFIKFASSNYSQLYLGTLKAFVQYCKEVDKTQRFAEVAERLYEESRGILLKDSAHGNQTVQPIQTGI